MDQELRAYLEEREARMETRMDERFARVDERFTRMDERFERVETETRQTRVLVEGLHDTVRLLAEGVIGTGERIDALREETTGRLEEIKGSVDMIHKILVPRVNSLENRVKILEDRAERENRDVLEVIREKFGLRRQA
ncbi:MAG TPA: hypothetical protein VH988_03315 [Thermoanaerobaculia bacterium]|nr:hypothetical protein [Thermoanaerobaculia bacterium]